MVQVLRHAARYLARNRKRKVVLALPSSLLSSEHLEPLWHDIKILNFFIGVKFLVLGNIAASENHVGIAARINQIIERYTEGISPLKADSALITSPVELDELTQIDTICFRFLSEQGKGGGEDIMPAYSLAVAATKNRRFDKIVFFLEPELFKKLGFSACSLDEAKAALGSSDKQVAGLIELGIAALQDNAVPRVHYVDGSVDGSLMLELLQADGEAGAMIYRDKFEDVRQATVEDIPAIAHLLDDGAFLPRTEDFLKQNIDSYAVITHDEAVIACASLNYFDDETAEFGSFSVLDSFTRNAFGMLLFNFFRDEAVKKGICQIVAVSAKNQSWFHERGFVDADISILPAERADQVLQRKREGNVLILPLK